MDPEYTDKLLSTVSAAATSTAQDPLVTLHAAYDAIIKGDFDALASPLPQSSNNVVTSLPPPPDIKILWCTLYTRIEAQIRQSTAYTTRSSCLGCAKSRYNRRLIVTDWPF
jgi:hypothetical protein